MTSQDVSQPEPPPLSPADQALVDLAKANTAIQASTQRRERAKTAAIVASMLGNLALAAGVLVLIFNVNHRANDAVRSADATLAIARGFQCQSTPGEKGCPPPRPGGAPAAGGAAAAGTQAIIDQVVYRVELFVARADGIAPPPRPADVPPTVAP